MKKLATVVLIMISLQSIYSQDNEVLKILSGNVEYISTQFIYVQFENTKGLEIGDTLFIKNKGKYIPNLIIESLSSRSCATKPMKGNLKKGIKIFGFIKLEKEKNHLPAKKDFSTTLNNEELVKVDTAEFIGFKKLDRGIYGRFSISSYSNISNIPNQVDSQNWRYSLSLNADQINNSNFSFSNYITFRYRADDWTHVSSNIGDAIKVYDLSLKYALTPTTNLIVGRKINRKVANIGSVDGIQLESTFNKFTFGGIIGSRPDYSNYGYNINLFQFGGYIHRKDSLGNGAMQNTFSVMQQMKNFNTDRRFLYLQHSNNIMSNINLFLTTEFDLFEKINGENQNNLRFTSLYLSLRYSPFRWISSSISYDARKNVIYYETFKNYTDQLIESALRQGFRFRVNLRPIRYVFASIYTGYRFRENDIRPTRNFGGSLTHSRVPYLNVSANLSYINLSTNYLNGNILGARISRDLFNGLLYGSIGYKKVDYVFTNSKVNLEQDIAQLDLSFRLGKNYTLSLYFEGTYEKNISYSNVYANFTTRF